jgi:hypothetical protein
MNISDTEGNFFKIYIISLVIYSQKILFKLVEVCYNEYRMRRFETSRCFFALSRYRRTNQNISSFWRVL